MKNTGISQTVFYSIQRKRKTSPKPPVMPYNTLMNTNPPMKPIKKEHWEDLYARLHDAYVECITHNNPTYEQKLAQVLDHMRVNKQHLYIK